MLDHVIAFANRDFSRPENAVSGKVVCADGFTMSVISGASTYCTPRNNIGPYSKVEVGFPSEKPEPWSEWSRYAEIIAWDDEEEDQVDPTQIIYAYVPVDLVRDLISLHGGEV